MNPDNDHDSEQGPAHADYVRPERRRWRGSWTAAVVGGVVVVALVGAVAVMRLPSGGNDLPMLRVGSQQRAMAEMGAADMMWTPTRFVLADGVDIAAGAAPAWRWTAPTDADVAGLAERLGLAGTPAPVAADMGGGWQLDGLTVAPSGDWYFGPTSVLSVCADPDVVAVAGQGGDIAQCEPVTPSAVPTEAEALATAERVIGGQTAAGFEVVSADPSWVAVEVTYLIDGQPSGQIGTLGFGSDGLSGFGRLGRAEPVGEYPTISAVDAVQRLNQPTGLGVVGNAMTLYRGIAVDEPVSSMSDVVEPIVPTETVVPAVPTETVVPAVPTETVVNLVGVRPVLVPFFDADGGVWSLPGYDYADADGQSWEVIAVSDDYIDADGDQPVDPPDSGATEPGFPGGDQPVDPPDSGATEPGFPGGELPSAPDVVGMTESEATVVIERAGFTVRVVARDGETFMVTEDFRADRVNVVVVEGVVTDAYMG